MYWVDTDRENGCGMSRNKNKCTTYQAFDIIPVNNERITFCDDLSDMLLIGIYNQTCNANYPN